MGDTHPCGTAFYVSLKQTSAADKQKVFFSFLLTVRFEMWKLTFQLGLLIHILKRKKIFLN